MKIEGTQAALKHARTNMWPSSSHVMGSPKLRKPGADVESGTARKTDATLHSKHHAKVTEVIRFVSQAATGSTNFTSYRVPGAGPANGTSPGAMPLTSMSAWLRSAVAAAAARNSAGGTPPTVQGTPGDGQVPGQNQVADPGSGTSPAKAAPSPIDQAAPSIGEVLTSPLPPAAPPLAAPPAQSSTAEQPGPSIAAPPPVASAGEVLSGATNALAGAPASVEKAQSSVGGSRTSSAPVVPAQAASPAQGPTPPPPLTGISSSPPARSTAGLLLDVARIPLLGPERAQGGIHAAVLRSSANSARRSSMARPLAIEGLPPAGARPSGGRGKAAGLERGAGRTAPGLAEAASARAPAQSKSQLLAELTYAMVADLAELETQRLGLLLQDPPSPEVEKQDTVTGQDTADRSERGDGARHGHDRPAQAD